ncbi:GFRA2 protein, partial [Smithornis capensis]|nr:GFRA2 protein [Smithornis capensis]
DEMLRSLAGPPGPGGQDPRGWRVPVDCVRANELCAAEPSCSSRYRTLRQCLAGRDRNTMLANKECQAALEVLQESPLYDCRCKRGMKKELQCLQIYWSIHLGLTEGEEFYEASPYEPVTSRLSDIFRLASIFSGNKSNMLWLFYLLLPMNTALPPSSLASKTCSSFPRALSFAPPAPQATSLPVCSQIPPNLMPWGALWGDTRGPCSCLGCRSWIDIPSLSLFSSRARSRLADFHTNCQATFQSLTSCPGDNYQACLGSYAGLIGFDMTPNYVDASTTSITISPWCSCKGSGNMEEECEKFLQDFTENPCLRKALPCVPPSPCFIPHSPCKPFPPPGNAIQAFGNGTDVNLSPKNPSSPVTAAPKAEKSPALPEDVNDSNTMYDTSIITTCTSVQEQGLKPNKSKEQSLCYSE